MSPQVWFVVGLGAVLFPIWLYFLVKLVVIAFYKAKRQALESRNGEERS